MSARSHGTLIIRCEKIVSALLLSLIIFRAHPLYAGPPHDNFITVSGFEGGGGIYINISIESVVPSNYEVNRGEAVIFTVSLRNRGEDVEKYIILRALSKKRVLAEKVVNLYSWNVKDMMVVAFTWDTSDNPPGNYPVTIEAPIFGDSDDFDNFYKLTRAIVIR